MAVVHDTATVGPAVELAEGVELGPNCVVSGRVTIGPGTRLLAGVHVQGPARIGERNLVYPTACLGFAPQSSGFDPATEGPGLVVGDDNVMREGFTAHRASTSERPTIIGDRNFLMANTHVAHDCDVGDDCVLANGALLAGHVQLADRVVIGGNSSVHQHVRIGRGAMISGMSGAARDLPPFFTATSVSVVGALNVVGLRRSGMSRDEIADVKWVYQVFSRPGTTPAEFREALTERADRPVIAEYLEFVKAAKRGICANRPSQGRPVA